MTHDFPPMAEGPRAGCVAASSNEDTGLPPGRRCRLSPAAATQPPATDVGVAVAFEVTTPRVERGEDGHPYFFHVCNGTPRRTILPLSRETGWWWTDEGDLAPSVNCTSCGTHGWWTVSEGWQPA